MSDHIFLTRTELAKRWKKDLKTINKWIDEGHIKTFRGTDNFQIDYIKGLEVEGLDFSIAKASELRVLKRRLEQSENENAMLKSTLYQVVAVANEVTAQLMKDKAV